MSPLRVLQDSNKLFSELPEIQIHGLLVNRKRLRILDIHDFISDMVLLHAKKTRV